ncbi:GrpB family protein [Jeotgalibacillus aurantiacus]|uniref:GrpB family protein n=1 Tax=Jeotgalibacillus aurantiacus TaxID=2763266 RepID=UPI001D09D4ED|nr:GrpB family protein [Jeotgalibacillus aurantiacus]
MLGLPKGEVFLVPWTEGWQREFESEKKRIEEMAGAFILEVHHIGSTSVPGLSAKPILDIAVEVSSFKLGEDCIAPLEKLDYGYKGTAILPDRHYFSKGEPRTHQIHLYETGSPYLEEQLKLRDILRNDEQVMREYESLKRELADAHQNDKHLYAERKTVFIKRILLNE